MAYLESKLNQLDNNIVPPAKEGGISALSGVKFSELYGHYIYTVPLFHHSFFLLKKAVKQQSQFIIEKISDRCRDQCVVDLELTHGNNFKTDYFLNKCHSEYTTQFCGPSVAKSHNVEVDTNRVFNECLAKNVVKEIQYENVLSCKKKAFNYYVEKSLEIEEELLNIALNKFS